MEREDEDDDAIIEDFKQRYSNIALILYSDEYFLNVNPLDDMMDKSNTSSMLGSPLENSDQNSSIKEANTIRPTENVKGLPSMMSIIQDYENITNMR